MFFTLGRLIGRAWFLVLAAWVVAVLVLRAAAPPWAEVTQDQETAFLPEGAPSRRAAEAFARAFPDESLGSNVVLVVSRDDAAAGGLEGVLKFIADVLEPGLRAIAAAEGGLAGAKPSADEPLFEDEAPAPRPPPGPRSVMSRIRTPNAPGAGALLVSEDERAALVVVELTTEYSARANWPTIGKVEELVGDLRREGKLPPGTDVSVTGSAVIGRDHRVAQLQSARATEVLTVVLVIGLLVLIYRAPLLALIPLATVFLAVQVARSLLAIAAREGYLTLFEGVEIYITILAYGAGVDYCLFLTSRYKEELDAGHEPVAALANAVGNVGAALVASAFTVMCGIGMMLFAQFGKFRDAGVAIPLSIALALLATLTFSPAVLHLAGRWAFWPQRPAGPGAAPARPGVLERGWDRIGHFLERRPGAAWLATVAAMLPFAIGALINYDRLSYNVIGVLPESTPSVVGTRVLQQHFPAGLLGPVNVLLVDPNVDFSTPAGRALAGRVTDHLRDHRSELHLADVRSLTTPLGITTAAKRGLSGFHVSADVRRELEEQAALERYTTDLGERRTVGTRFDLVLEQSPFSDQSVADLERVSQAVRAALPPDSRPQVQLWLAGTTASVRDLEDVVRHDRTRIELLVLAGVLVILLVLLRQFVVSVYLLLSVLFSYYATLGVTFAVFWLLDPAGFSGIDWKVAIFLFTILIAVGEDYNIFLMSRVGEEQRRHGPVRGVTVALDRTGPIISSCGIIMAGTFASLLGGTLNDMKQLGFALAFGVLLDTFVVRPILVPSFLILLHGGRLFGRRHDPADRPNAGELPRRTSEPQRPQSTGS